MIDVGRVAGAPDVDVGRRFEVREIQNQKPHHESPRHPTSDRPARCIPECRHGIDPRNESLQRGGRRAQEGGGAPHAIRRPVTGPRGIRHPACVRLALELWILHDRDDSARLRYCQGRGSPPRPWKADHSGLHARMHEATACLGQLLQVAVVPSSSKLGSGRFSPLLRVGGSGFSASGPAFPSHYNDNVPPALPPRNRIGLDDAPRFEVPPRAGSTGSTRKCRSLSARVVG